MSKSSLYALYSVHRAYNRYHYWPLVSRYATLFALTGDCLPRFDNLVCFTQLHNLEFHSFEGIRQAE
jgi:hypothetical protein